MLKKIYKWAPFFLLFIPFKLLALINRKRNTVLLFGTGTGLYHDNSKYLFEYLLANNDLYGYEVYWVAKNKELYKELKKLGKPVLLKNSLGAVFKASCAKAYFITAEIFDVFWYIKPTTLLIQLWHGTPIKKIAYDTAAYKYYLEKREKYFTKNYSFSRFDYFIIEDENYRNIFLSAFRIDKEKVMALGQPRNTIFGSELKLAYELKRDLSVDVFDKIILYAPTFRENEVSNVEVLDLLLQEDALQFLEKYNYCLLIKLHPYVSSLASIKECLTNIYHPNIINVSDYTDTQELLLISDALVTDISSLAFDYMMSSDNLYTFFPDIDDYRSIRGGFYNTSYDLLYSKSNPISSLNEIGFVGLARRKFESTTNFDILKLLES